MRKFSGVILLLFIISCDAISESQISEKFDGICSGKNCEIDMRNIVTEDWDYVYIFNTSVPLEEINSQLGFSYPYFEDVGTRIIFVKNHTVVYHEDEFPDFDGRKKGELVFNIGDSGFTKIERSKAIFLVNRLNDFWVLKIK